MGRKPKSRPSFFKVMVNDDFTRYLRLPPLFVRRYGEILPERIKLRTSCGETSWNVELELVDKKTCYFSRGWTKFSVDVGLKVGEFIVFWFDVGRSTFDFSIYDHTCCERKISGSDSRIDDSVSDEEVRLIKCSKGIDSNSQEVENDQSRAYVVGKEAVTDDIQENDHPQMKLLLRKQQSGRVVIFKQFAMAAGLMRKNSVMLRYPPKQRRWLVKLLHYPNNCRLDMSKGWSEFRRKNGLAFGKTYLLEYIRDENVIDVQLFKKEN